MSLSKLFPYLGKEEQTFAIALWLLREAVGSQSGHGARTAAEITRSLDLSLATVHQRLQRCNDLFIRLPPRPGKAERYCLASAVSALDEAALQRWIRRRLWADRVRVMALGIATLSAVLVILLAQSLYWL